MKQPLVLLPGLLSNEKLWKHQIEHLSGQADIQIIRSLENSPKKMVQAILEAAPPKFALAGHSMGGWLSLEVMRTAPNRVKKLCLLNTTSAKDADEKKHTRMKLIQKAKEGKFNEVAQEILDIFVSNSDEKSEVLEMFLEEGVEVFLAQETSMLIRDECESILPNISCPTLVIHAAKDRVFSFENHRRLADQIPSAKLAVIEDPGHMSPMEMPQAVTALLRFWLSYFDSKQGLKYSQT